MKTYFTIVVCQTLFDPCEVLAKALQAVSVTATGAVRASNVLLIHLRKLRDEDEFDHLYRQAEIDAASLELKVEATTIGNRPVMSSTGQTPIQV